jgi:hypothetical protein
LYEPDTERKTKKQSQFLAHLKLEMGGVLLKDFVFRRLQKQNEKYFLVRKSGTSHQTSQNPNFFSENLELAMSVCILIPAPIVYLR